MSHSYLLEIIQADNLPPDFHIDSEFSVQISLDEEIIFISNPRPYLLESISNDEVSLKCELQSKLSIAMVYETRLKKLLNPVIPLGIFVPWAVKRQANTVLRYSLGSHETTVENLLKKCLECDEATLDLIHNGAKTGSLRVRFTQEEDAPINMPEASSKVIPPELSLGFLAPTHPNDPTAKLQIAGYRSKEISITQAEDVVEQVLARAEML